MRRTPLRRLGRAGRPRATGRRRAPTPLAPALLLIGLVLSLAGPVAAGASTDGSEAPSPSVEGLDACPADREAVAAADEEIRIAKVAGLIDPVVFDYLIDELDDAEADPDSLGLIVWVNSRGSVLSEERYRELAGRLRDSPLQTALWVGQAGSTAEGGAAELASVVDVVGVTPNSTIGRIGPRRLPADWGDAFADVDGDVENELLSAEEAVRGGVSVGPLQNTVPIGSFATELDGFEVLRCVNEEGNLETLPITRARISGLSLSSQLFHTAASPEVAYLFFALGLSLLVFELFTAGVGVAGVIGAGFVALGGYGLAVLPARWWAIALILVSFVLLAVDIQTNVPRLYTVAGLVVFVVGSWFLYDGVSISWVTLGAVWIGAILYAYAGMPSMVRTRFSTPTIGRKWMIGELGEAVTDVDPEGTVKIRDVAWRAITNRATPVRTGERVRVVAIDRLLLEIEPEEGGARDYRERS
jgi:membrane-bound serine protease (ClpP class)